MKTVWMHCRMAVFFILAGVVLNALALFKAVDSHARFKSFERIFEAWENQPLAERAGSPVASGGLAQSLKDFFRAKGEDDFTINARPSAVAVECHAEEADFFYSFLLEMEKSWPHARFENLTYSKEEKRVTAEIRIESRK